MQQIKQKVFGVLRWLCLTALPAVYVLVFLAARLFVTLAENVDLAGIGMSFDTWGVVGFMGMWIVLVSVSVLWIVLALMALCRPLMAKYRALRQGGEIVALCAAVLILAGGAVYLALLAERDILMDTFVHNLNVLLPLLPAVGLVVRFFWCRHLGVKGARVAAIVTAVLLLTTMFSSFYVLWMPGVFALKEAGIVWRYLLLLAVKVYAIGCTAYAALAPVQATKAA